MIQEYWPVDNDGSKTIYLQHDNASIHFGCNNHGPFRNVATALDGWDINLKGQPAISLDMLNVNGLSFLALQR